MARTTLSLARSFCRKHGLDKEFLGPNSFYLQDLVDVLEKARSLGHSESASGEEIARQRAALDAIRAIAEGRKP